MAIYNNREVSVISEARMQAAAPSTLVVQYSDGSHETVSAGQVKFTEEEKKALIKAYPSRYDGVNTISEEDLKAVRAGVAPSYDPDYRARAEGQVKTEEAQKINQHNMDKAKQEAKKDQDKPVSANSTVNK